MSHRRSIRTALLAMTLGLGCALPASAQMVYEPYAPNAERSHVTGPHARYQTHILKHGAHRYSVMFKPGWVDAVTAISAVAPLCTRAGLRAAGVGNVAPVSVVNEHGEDSVQQGYRVDCI